MATAARGVRTMTGGRRGPEADHRSLVLAIVPDASKQESLRAALEPFGWSPVFAPNAASGLEQQRLGRFPLVIYDKDAADDDWRRAVDAFSATPPQPCVILLARRADRNLWEELVRRGGYDVVKSPVRAEDAAAVLASGLSLWRIQHRLRGHAAAVRS